MVSFIGLKTKVGGKNMEPTKKDWKLYRERIGDWQEAYMEKLVQKYVEYLQENLPASDKFWELENRIKNDKKKPGVLIEVRKSSMIWDIVRLIHDEVVTVMLVLISGMQLRIRSTEVFLKNTLTFFRRFLVNLQLQERMINTLV